jgi:hypothetical protein
LYKRLSNFIQLKSDSIYSFIISDAAIPAAEKEKAVLSLGYFMNEIGKNISQQRSEMYDIPGAFESYQRILKALLYHRRFSDELLQLPARRSQVLATAFSQYKEHVLLEDISVYKRMASTPDFILRFLENNLGFRFADSL